MVASCTMEYHSKSMVFFCFIGQFDEILYEIKSSIKIKNQSDRNCRAQSL